MGASVESRRSGDDSGFRPRKNFLTPFGRNLPQRLPLKFLFKIVHVQAPSVSSSIILHSSFPHKWDAAARAICLARNDTGWPPCLMEYPVRRRFARRSILPTVSNAPLRAGPAADPPALRPARRERFVRPDRWLARRAR